MNKPPKDWFIKHGHSDSPFFISFRDANGAYHIEVELTAICQELQGRMPTQEELNELWYPAIYEQDGRARSLTDMRRRARQMWANSSNKTKVEGRIRLGYEDDSGPYLPLSCHHMHGLFVHRVNRKRSLELLDQIVDAGYDIVRTIMCCGWWDGFWKTDGVYPVDFKTKSGRDIKAWDDYDEVAEDYFTELTNRNLRLNMTFGDGQMFGNRQKTINFVARVGNLARPFKNLICLVEWNEAWQNWFDPNPTPPEVKGVIDTIVQEYRQSTIRGISDSTEEVADLNAWAYDISLKHGYRGGDDHDKIRHAWGINYDEGHGKPSNKVGFDTEPPGVGTSVGQIRNIEGLCLLAAANLMGGYGHTYICKPGIKWEGEQFNTQPGFKEVGKVREIIPPDVMTLKNLYHGGRPEAVLTSNFREIKRVDHVMKDGRFFAIAYSERPVTGELTARRKCEFKVTNPVSRNSTNHKLNSGESIFVTYDRGVFIEGTYA